MSAQDILEKFGDMLHVTNVISSIFRQVGEWLLNGLLFVNSIVEKVTMSILTSTDFFQYGPLKDLRNEMAPLIWSLMGLTVILIGFQLMFNKIEKRHNVVLNGLIAVLFIVGGPTMMDLLNKISTNAINDLDHAGAETAGQKIVKNNLADVNYYARQGFEVKKLPDEQRYNNISADNIKYIHFTEVVNLDGVKGEAKEALNNQLVVNDDNKIEMKKLDDGWFGVGKQEYYRWDLNWAVVLVSLLVTVVALIVTIVKVGRIIFDLGFHGI
ncbi:pLS20_p028 family conjugation system transmembrane protein, partial [Bacillus licheniformis]|uniref:pLS20_p028 family conjugation system transmembrane protein n=2 Tax=Bacillus TaxID=1386 RepID=UPI003215A15D